MGRLPYYIETGQHGDGRESRASSYIGEHAPRGDPDAALAAMEAFHRQCQTLLILGPEKGRHLDEAVRKRAPLCGLEIGTYLGYSAIRIARLLRDGARLFSLESNPSNARLAEENIAHAGLEHRVTVLCGTADAWKSKLQTLAPDLIFLDHSKAIYLEELQRLEAWGLVRPCTVVVADNVMGLKHLAMREGAISRGKRKRACNCQLRACNYMNYVQNSGRYESEVFWGPKDGIAISVARQPALERGNSLGDRSNCPDDEFARKPSPAALATHLAHWRSIGLPVVGGEPYRLVRSRASPAPCMAVDPHCQMTNMGLSWDCIMRQLSAPPMSAITSLDLSRNRLVELPGIGALRALTQLDLSYNRFKRLPEELLELHGLTFLNVSRNFLTPSAQSLLLPGLKQLPELRILDLRFNAKCGQQELADTLARELPAATVRITLWGQIVGISPSARDSTLLRSQLEPWPTPMLRRRLAQDFGQHCNDLENMERGEVMERLLACYAKEGPERKVVKVDGVPVSTSVLDELLVEMRRWSATHSYNKERPSISAKSYMILRSPAAFLQQSGSAHAKRAAAKLAKFARLWELASSAIMEVDPEFAATFTELAVTYGFQGSPHIDKQNQGPFYGLAFGNFPEGQGGLCVECNARLVAEVNTRNRLGKVDGRFPHWVAPYDSGAERYSLIYYRTDGEWCPPTTALFPPVAA